MRLEFEFEDGTRPKMKWEICSKCKGEGRGPFGMSGLVFTSDDMAEDPDFADSYARGDYDSRCEGCGGRGSVKAVDVASMTAERKAEYDEWIKAEWEAAAVYAQERRMGA